MEFRFRKKFNHTYIHTLCAQTLKDMSIFGRNQTHPDLYNSSRNPKPTQICITEISRAFLIPNLWFFREYLL